MKKIYVYILGVVTGILLTTGAVMLIAYANKNASNITILEEPGQTLDIKAFKVIQVIEGNRALAYEASWSKVLKSYQSGELLVLITNDEGEHYYDQQLIEVPRRHEVRQIGVYNYTTNTGVRKTVPVIKIMEK